MEIPAERRSALLETLKITEVPVSSGMCSVGSYLATRLEQVGSGSRGRELYVTFSEDTAINFLADEGH
jgi:hypothetical protein